MNSSLDTLRRRAKKLRKAFEAGDSTAIQRLQVHNPRKSGDLLHADFLHVIAREEGFESWPKLTTAAQTRGLAHAQKLQRLKMALYHGQMMLVDRLLADTPDLAEGHFGLHVALLNKPVVEAMLAEDPSRATTLLGPRRPILHLAYSRYIQSRPDLADDMLAIAALLHEHGADVNDSFPGTPGSEHQLSALHGAVGHADNMILARWLLERGANPNDGESLYHSTELGHHEGLRLLLEFGADPAGTNALLRAMDFHDHTAVKMLLDAAAKIDNFNTEPTGSEPPLIIPPLHQAARRMSDEKMIELLLVSGADPLQRFEGASAYGYACVFGNPSLRRVIESRGATSVLTDEEQLLTCAADGLSTTDQYVDPERIPDTYRDIIRLILHLPGKLDHVKRLVALGVEYDRPDSEGLTPIQISGWEGLPDVLRYLLSLKPDLTHVNGYGGTLLSTIIHGSENCPARATRDYIACAKLVLEEGVALPASTAELAGEESLSKFLADWADAHPGQVV